MNDEQRSRILARFNTSGAGLKARQLGKLCAEVTRTAGAGLMLMSGDTPGGSVATTDRISTELEELQFSLGEGPCIDAYNQNRAVLEPDLASPEIIRWVAFTPPALRAGARAVFGFPLQIGTVRLGSLNLYNDRAGSLTVDQHADALAMADIAAQAILAMQTDTPPGVLSTELETGANLRLVVHQAAGMVAAQLDVPITEAMIRMRGRAFSQGRTLTDLAKDVVHRSLRFTRDDPDTGIGNS